MSDTTTHHPLLGHFGTGFLPPGSSFITPFQGGVVLSPRWGGFIIPLRGGGVIPGVVSSTFFGGGTTSFGVVYHSNGIGGLMQGSPAAQTKCSITSIVHGHLYSSNVQFQSSLYGGPMD